MIGLVIILVFKSFNLIWCNRVFFSIGPVSKTIHFITKWSRVNPLNSKELAVLKHVRH